MATVGASPFDRTFSGETRLTGWVRHPDGTTTPSVAGPPPEFSVPWWCVFSPTKCLKEYIEPYALARANEEMEKGAARDEARLRATFEAEKQKAMAEFETKKAELQAWIKNALVLGTIASLVTRWWR